MGDPVSSFNRAKAINSQLNRAEYREGRSNLRSLPRALFVELTQGCNLTCRMCRDHVVPLAGSSMSDELFDRIASELFATAELVDLRGWGESLILPNICERIETVCSFGAALRVVTNLSFRKDEVLRALVRADATIGVSLDSADPEVVRQLRTGAELGLISRNLRWLRTEFGHMNNVAMLVAVQRPALATLPGLIEFASQHHVRDVRLFAVTAGATSPLSINGHDEEVSEAVKDATATALRCGIELTAGTQLGALPENRPTFPRCNHPWSYCYINFEGGVSFCDHLIGPGNAKFLVGRLAEESFPAIWNGSSWISLREQHVRSRIAGNELFSHCAWCYRSKYVDFEHTLEAVFESERVVLAPRCED